MTNRFFDRQNSCFRDLNRRNSVRPFNFAFKQQRAFVAELEQQLLELEKQFATQRCVPPIPQQRTSTAVSASDSQCHRCTYDDFGLVEGLDLDVSWM